MASKRIGLPGLGARLKGARKQMGLTQESVAESLGVSWMTVHRWEHEQRTISEERLELVSRLYGKTLRWFLTVNEADLDLLGARNDAARRIYQRVDAAPEKYHAMLERVVDDVLGELEASEGLDQGNGRRLRARR